MSTLNESLYNLTGIRITPGACIVLVQTEWNASYIRKLREGALQVLEEKGVRTQIITVPGAVEISFAIRQHWLSSLATAAPVHAYIALGCVIKGDTPHFDYVCQSVTQGITTLNLELPVPVIFGVLTVNSEMQAEERLGGKHGHKGAEAAVTALKMMALFPNR